jgi:hypothetical protein
MRFLLIHWLAFFSALPSFSDLGSNPDGGASGGGSLASGPYSAENAVDLYVDESGLNQYVTET